MDAKKIKLSLKSALVLLPSPSLYFLSVFPALKNLKVPYISSYTAGAAQQMRRRGHSGTRQAFIYLGGRSLGARGNKITTDEKSLKGCMQHT